MPMKTAFGASYSPFKFSLYSELLLLYPTAKDVYKGRYYIIDLKRGIPRQSLY